MDSVWILIVEDDEVLAEDLESALSHVGYRCVRTQKAPEAVSKLRNQKFACILLDMKLERGSGEEIITTIRRSKKEQNFYTPVIVTSGYLDADLVKRIGAQVHGILVKPFDRATLIEKVKTAIASPEFRLHK